MFVYESVSQCLISVEIFFFFTSPVSVEILKRDGMGPETLLTVTKIHPWKHEPAPSPLAGMHFE